MFGLEYFDSPQTFTEVESFTEIYFVWVQKDHT